MWGGLVFECYRSFISGRVVWCWCNRTCCAGTIGCEHVSVRVTTRFKGAENFTSDVASACANGEFNCALNRNETRFSESEFWWHLDTAPLNDSYRILLNKSSYYSLCERVHVTFLWTKQLSEWVVWTIKKIVEWEQLSQQVVWTNENFCWMKIIITTSCVTNYPILSNENSSQKIYVWIGLVYRWMK